MPNSSIWVLVANERNAAICSSRNGASQLLLSLQNEDEMDAADPIGTPQSRCRFVWELMSTLKQGAIMGACDGIVIVAEADMLYQLRQVMPVSVARLVLAEIPDPSNENAAWHGHLATTLTQPQWEMAQ